MSPQSLSRFQHDLKPDKPQNPKSIKTQTESNTKHKQEYMCKRYNSNMACLIHSTGLGPHQIIREDHLHVPCQCMPSPRSTALSRG